MVATPHDAHQEGAERGETGADDGDRRLGGGPVGGVDVVPYRSCQWCLAERLWLGSYM